MKKLELVKKNNLVQVGKFRITGSEGESLFKKGEVFKDRKGTFWVMDKFKEGETYIFWIPHKPRPKRIRVKLVKRTPDKLVFEIIASSEQRLSNPKKDPNVQKENRSHKAKRAPAKNEGIHPKEHKMPQKIQKRRNWGRTVGAMFRLLLGGFFLVMAIFSFIEGEVVLGIVLLIVMAGIFDGSNAEQNSQHNVQPTVYDDDDYYYNYLDELEEDSLIELMVYYLDD
ncbi:hypothetical protein [Thermococcus sp. JdF3]|uniref:hypothetical protein n=1 Tax=Thermococcus sp. JdF3 TaxID=1638258 RepID=UPI00143BB2CA|nr:hypothetical protein [Thermococcus sp. JdF3]NJE02114.1 hypothetical protein [Thermococcus sp. JdF3]